MSIEITIPSPGESITEVMVGLWHKQSGEWVEKDETLVEIESDKVTLEVSAPESGILQVQTREGRTMSVGDVIGAIDTEAKRPAASAPPAASPVADAPPPSTEPLPTASKRPLGDGESKATSLARKLAEDKGVDLARIAGTGPSGRVTKSDVLTAAAAEPLAAQAPSPPASTPTRAVRRERMSKLRQRIAERLVAAQRTAAMLTTFNEADMSEVIRLRKEHKEAFLEIHGVGLGFMSFFVRACVSALGQFPRLNASIAGEEIEYHDYVDVSIAVGTEKGLVAPVIRNAGQLSFAEIEKTILSLATRAHEGKLTLEEMTGGTFTISNGGVYGSMLSTPILNPPQSGILGMHKIANRPVEDPDQPGQITLRPVMYLALSYDHRIVDGTEAVTFLVHVRNCIEDPARLMLAI